MKRFVEGEDRSQSTLFPERLDDYVNEDNPVRVVDVFVDELDLGGLTLRRYWTHSCQGCAIKAQCTTGKERRITRWEHEHLLEEIQQRLEEYPEKMKQRRETVEHPFGTIKSWMGYTHFQMKTLKRVGTEMALHVLAYNIKRVINIIGIRPLIAAMKVA